MIYNLRNDKLNNKLDETILLSADIGYRPCRQVQISRKKRRKIQRK